MVNLAKFIIDRKGEASIFEELNQNLTGHVLTSNYTN